MDPELTATYLQDARSVAAGLEDATVDLWVPDDRPRALDTLWVLSHRLHGTAGLYGHPQTAALAALLERLMEGRAHLNTDDAVPILTEILERANTCFGQALNRIEQGQSEGDVGLLFAELGGPAQVTDLLRTQPFALQARQARSDTQEEPPFAVVNAAIWEDFGPEAAELAATLRSGLHADTPDLTALFRAAHTLKGSSAMVGLSDMAEVGHAMEDLLGAAREDAVTLDRALPLIDDGLNVVDLVLAHAEGQVRESPQLRIQGYRAAVAALLSGQDPATLIPTPEAAVTPVPEARLSVRVDSGRLDGMLDDVAGLVAARARLNGVLLRQQQIARSLDAAHERVQRTVRDFEERYLNPNLTPGGASAGVPLDRLPGQARPGTDLGLQDRLADFGALELDSYDDLNILARAVTELSADLVEVRAQTAQAISTLGDELTGLEKLTRQLRVELSRARLVPLERVTAPLHRWAGRRDDLKLTVTGEDSLIDAQYAAPLGQALLHLLTNAAVHGAQSPEERAAHGKPALLQVGVDAHVSDGHLHVTVRDDGRGLNFEALRQRALQSGHLSAGELNVMTDEQTAQLVFLPGLSTAAQVTQEAGRGVGMDAVRDAITRLGGRVSISSAPGQGTATTLHVPVAQQITDVLVLRAGNARVAVLASQVQGMTVLDGDAPHGSVDLSALWGETPAPTRYVARLSVPEADGGTLHVIVDEFQSIEEIVLRPAGNLLSPLEYLSGMTTLNDEHGQAYPVAVLNPAGLRRARAAQRTATSAATQSAGRILLVDDSLSVRRHVGRSLERFGYQVATASDGQEALERLLAGEQADLLLSDLEMPRMNGFELLRAVRSSPAHAGLPVVIMTTRAGEKHQQLAMELGANDYLAKPAEERLLHRRLDALLAAGVRA
nr:hybrid sensor histidine kinase/response regulator [Deinococcus sp. JMULE3]